MLFLVWFPNHDLQGFSAFIKQHVPQKRQHGALHQELTPDDEKTVGFFCFIVLVPRLLPGSLQSLGELGGPWTAPRSKHTYDAASQKHHPASCELTVPQAAYNCSHSFPEIKLLAQQFAPLICKIVELSLVTVTHTHPRRQRTSEVASALISEITARKWKRHKNTNDNIHRWRKLKRRPSDICRPELWHCQ